MRGSALHAIRKPLAPRLSCTVFLIPLALITGPGFRSR